jgi:dihydrodipicolinate synthase/N-acetylneuraminate lyase
MSTKTSKAQKILPRFRGVYPAIPTPITEDDQIDALALGRMVNYLLDGGVHGIWALGSGGEFTALNREQRQLTVETIVEETSGRVPVFAGISACDIDEIEANARMAADAGADGVFMISPYYFRYSLDDIRRYFERAADNSPLPLVVYHNSHNSNIFLTVEAVEALSRHPNIIGLKDAGCNFALHQAFQTAFKDRDDFIVFQGDDTAMASAFLFGSAGTVAALPVVAPRMIVDLFEAGQQGKVKEAQELQQRAMDLFKMYEVTGELNDSSFLTTQKAALELLGLSTRRLVPPAAPLEARFLPKLREILTRHNLPVRVSEKV